MKKRRENFKISTKILSLIVAVSMLFSLSCTSLFSVSAADKTSASYSSGAGSVQDFATETGAVLYEVSNATKLVSAIGNINSSTTEDNFVISLTSDIDLSRTVSFTNGSTTILGNGYSLNCSADTNTIYLSNSATLNLGSSQAELNDTLNIVSKSNGDLIIVNKATLNMYDGVTIQMDSAVADSRAVLLGNSNVGAEYDATGSTFNMHGGTIQNFKVISSEKVPIAAAVNDGSSEYYMDGGSGVFVCKNAQFNMSGNSIISNCDSVGDDYTYISAGGGVTCLGSTMTMSDYSKIENCDAWQGKAAHGCGGGIFMWDSALTMTDNSTIYKCSASKGGGICAGNNRDLSNYDPYIININGGTISNCSSTSNGGAIFMQTCMKLNLQNCQITDNAAETEGGAIYASSCDVNVNNNAEISSNTSTNGGSAIFGLKSKIEMTGGRIINNKVTGTYGGGSVYITRDNGNPGQSTFTMNGGIISENIAYYGGGVYLDKGNLVSFVMSGGSIENNYAIVGGGVFADSSSNFTLKDNGKILNNSTMVAGDDIYSNCSKIKVVDAKGFGTLDVTGREIDGWYEDGNSWDLPNDKTHRWNEKLTYDITGYCIYSGLLKDLFYDCNMHNGDSYILGFTVDECNYFGSVYSVLALKAAHSTYDVKFHSNYGSDEIFRTYAYDNSTEYKFNSDDTISAFYDIPQRDGYIFEGWYSAPVGGTAMRWTDVYTKTTHLYAHWLEIGTVDKDSNDKNKNISQYDGFGLAGVQVREDGFYDPNIEKVRDGGLRFVTSIREDILTTLDGLFQNEYSPYKKENVKYGYAVAKYDTVANKGNDYKLSLDDVKAVADVDCTSQQKGTKGSVEFDHKNFEAYRLYTVVINYTNGDADKVAAAKDANIVARSYIKYTDANGLQRTFYNNYIGGSGAKFGGCSVSYNTALSML